MAKRKKSKNIKVIFLKDYENNKKGDITEISLALFSNKLRFQNIAREATSKDIRKFEELQRKKEEENIKKQQIEQEKKQKEIELEKKIKEQEKKQKEELEKSNIIDIYKNHKNIYKGLEVRDFNDLSYKISKKLQFSSKELSLSKLREYFEKIKNTNNNGIYLKIILSEIRYDISRVKNLPKEFEEFIDYNLKQIGDNLDKLGIFIKHYEAIIAYTK